MKRKLFLFTILVVSMFAIFTVSASAANEVVIGNPLTGELQVFEIASNEVKVRYELTSSGVFNVYIDGSKVDLTIDTFDPSVAIPSGLCEGSFLSGNYGVAPDVSLLDNKTFTFDPDKYKRRYFFVITYDFVGEYDEYGYKKISSGSDVAGDVIIVSCQGDLQKWIGGAGSGVAFEYSDSTQSLTISHTTDNKFTITGYGVAYQDALSAYSSSKNVISSVMIQCADDAVLTMVGNFCAACVLQPVPNNYSIYVASFDKTTGSWYEQRIADSSLVSSALKFSAVARDGKCCLEIVTSSGTSYMEMMSLSEGAGYLMTTNVDKTDRGYVMEGYTMADLPIDLLSREAECVDKKLTIYVGPPVPVYGFLEDVPDVDADLMDVVEKLADMVTVIPIMSLFVVLLPFLSFCVGLLIRSKHKV